MQLHQDAQPARPGLKISGGEQEKAGLMIRCLID